MRRDTLVQLLSVLALAACLVTSSILADWITASAGRHKLTYVVRAEDNAPPQVGLGIAMGAFRGIFVNYLWIRANKLKEEGKYHEAVDLASTITKLEPRFPAVWSFHAWNMAYNISVTTQTLTERWGWVSAGINLLRRQGVVYNPNDLQIHKELGWIHLHKIAGVMDDANMFYKRQVAIEWTEVLGPPPPPRPRETRDQAIQKYVDWLAPIDRAPDRFEDLVKAVPSVAPLAEALERRVGLSIADNPLDHPMLIQVQRHRSIERSGLRTFIQRTFGDKNKALAELLADPANADAWAALLAYVRRRTLIVEYNMEPARMIRYTRKYGPLDWRCAAAHGVYWTARGVEGAITRVNAENRRDFDFINTDRVLIQSVQEMYRSGDLYFDYISAILYPENRQPLYLGGPNPHYILTYGQILEELRERGGIAENLKRTFTVYSAGYENFMKDAIRFVYRLGNRDQAREMKDALRDWPHANLNEAGRADRYALDIDEFVQQELADRLTTYYVARDEIMASLQGAFVTGLLAQDEDLFRDQMTYSRLVHDIFSKAQLRTTTLNPGEGRMAQFPPFNIMAGQVFAGFIGILEFDDAELAYTSAPDDLKRFAYDAIADRYRELLEETAKEGGRTFAQVFPEPPGMAEHRAAMQRYQDELARLRLDVQQK
jgi:hypothetical protein